MGFLAFRLHKWVRIRSHSGTPCISTYEQRQKLITKIHADLVFQMCISFLRCFRTRGTPTRKISGVEVAFRTCMARTRLLNIVLETLQDFMVMRKFAPFQVLSRLRILDRTELTSSEPLKTPKSLVVRLLVFSNFTRHFVWQRTDLVALWQGYCFWKNECVGEAQWATLQASTSPRTRCGLF